MKHKKKKPWQATAIIIVMGIIFAFVLTRLFFSVKSIASTQPVLIKAIAAPEIKLASSTSLVIGLPVRLKIPKIKVDSTFEYAGLTEQGAVSVPEDIKNVLWFNLGPRPGEDGSAVITGHYGRKQGKSSVFDNLYKLRKGDEIQIVDDQGEVIFFVVREIRRFDRAADAVKVFSAGDGKAHLNLITCEGAYDKTLKTYPSRLVIFSDRVIK